MRCGCPPRDYEYYGPRRTSCEKRIADAVIAYAEEEGALLERVPTVIMQVDPSLLLGDVRTQARFSNPDEPIVRPATAKRAPEPVRTGPVGGVKTQLFRPNAERAQPELQQAPRRRAGRKRRDGAARNLQAFKYRNVGTRGQKPAGATAGARGQPTPAPACAAQGTTSNNPRKHLRETDGGRRDARARIGVRAHPRTRHRPPPSEAASASASGSPRAPPSSRPRQIPKGSPPSSSPPGSPPKRQPNSSTRTVRSKSSTATPSGACARSASPRPPSHLTNPITLMCRSVKALFSCDEGSWSLVSFGRNGTSVQRDGIWTELSTSVPFALRDGDRISFAKSAPLTFSLS